uniref:Uncharacterized protein n=1 Tax=Anguilla anguilla TaxID=7936 RepID=A0A0E9V739_ANGAN
MQLSLSLQACCLDTATKYKG